jgi:hypothetical protein
MKLMNKFFISHITFYLNQKKSVENTDKISFTVSINVWLALHRLSQRQSKNMDSMGANSLMSLCKG